MRAERHKDGESPESSSRARLAHVAVTRIIIARSPRTLTANDTTTLVEVATGHVVSTTSRGGAVRAVAWSGDSALLAVGSFDRTAAIVDISTGAVVCESVRGGAVYCVAWSRDDACLAIGADNDASSRGIATITEAGIHGGSAIVVPVAATGTVVCEVSRGDAGEWSVARSGRSARASALADGAAVAWSTDGARLAVGAGDGGVAIVDVTAGEVTRALTSGGGAVASIAWSSGIGGTNPNPKVRKSGAVGKAVLAQDPGFDGAKSSFFLQNK